MRGRESGTFFHFIIFYFLKKMSETGKVCRIIATAIVVIGVETASCACALRVDRGAMLQGVFVFSSATRTWPDPCCLQFLLPFVLYRKYCCSETV